MSYPEPVQQLYDVIDSLDGVKDVEMGIQSLQGMDESVFSLPGEFADLPHLALRRSGGGLENELLVTAEIRFFQNHEGWIALEFLAWWVRDLSRSDWHVQMRPLALPPVAYEKQLGRTLKFVIEFFFINPETDNAPVLAKIKELADSLQGSVDTYAEALANPTQAEFANIEEMTRAAESDNASAQLTLAECYEHGEGVEANPEKAFYWYERAAQGSHPQAVASLGLCYENGTGVEPDPDKAFACYQQAATGGLPFAMGLLASCYETGVGTKIDLSKAVEWYQKGAEYGSEYCQAELGECYELGKGVDQDYQQALHWYQAALDQGFDEVQPAIDRITSALGQ